MFERARIHGMAQIDGVVYYDSNDEESEVDEDDDSTFHNTIQVENAIYDTNIDDGEPIHGETINNDFNRPTGFEEGATGVTMEEDNILYEQYCHVSGDLYYQSIEIYGDDPAATDEAIEMMANATQSWSLCDGAPPLPTHPILSLESDMQYQSEIVVETVIDDSEHESMPDPVVVELETGPAVVESETDPATNVKYRSKPISKKKKKRRNHWSQNNSKKKTIRWKDQPRISSFPDHLLEKEEVPTDIRRETKAMFDRAWIHGMTQVDGVVWYDSNDEDEESEVDEDDDSTFHDTFQVESAIYDTINDEDEPIHGETINNDFNLPTVLKKELQELLWKRIISYMHNIVMSAVNYTISRLKSMETILLLQMK